MDRPLLRRKWPRIITGSLSFLFGRKPSDRRHCCQQWSKEEEANKGGRDGRRGLRPPPHLYRKKANQRLPRSQVMMVFLACRRDLSSHAVAEAAWGSGDAHVQSTATRQLRLQAFGACGAPNLTLGFTAKPIPSAPWARGLLSAFWEWGSLDLSACGLQHGSRNGPVWPTFISSSSRPSGGAWLPGAQARTWPSPQARRHSCRGPAISRWRRCVWQGPFQSREPC